MSSVLKNENSCSKCGEFIHFQDEPFWSAGECRECWPEGMTVNTGTTDKDVEFEKAWSVVKGKTGDPAEDGCSKCGVKGDDVHECWNCDKHLCIDCDPGEMRSDFDGHTYCDKCGPERGPRILRSKG